MKVSQRGIDFIKHFEGLHDGDLSKVGLQPKLCPANVWTVGYGRALTYSNGRQIKNNVTVNELARIVPQMMTITEEQAEDFLREDLVKFERIVERRLYTKLNQGEFDALVSHTYNTGGSDTLFRLINDSPRDVSTLSRWWTSTYITSGGVYLKGLQIRRNLELHLFLTGEFKV